MRASENGGSVCKRVLQPINSSVHPHPVRVDRRKVIDMQLLERFPKLFAHVLSNLACELIGLILKLAGDGVEAQLENAVDRGVDELAENETNHDGRVGTRQGGKTERAEELRVAEEEVEERKGREEVNLREEQQLGGVSCRGRVVSTEFKSGSSHLRPHTSTSGRARGLRRQAISQETIEPKAKPTLTENGLDLLRFALGDES